MDLPNILRANDMSVIPPIRLVPERNLSNDLINEVASRTSTLGITWRAGTTPETTNKKEKYLTKEIPLTDLCTALKNFKGTIVVLQRNPARSELEYLSQHLEAELIDASSINEDLSMMLQLLSKLDRYIGVSNTNTHLFGSLGKQCDVIVPFPGEWRWMWEGEYSPWYGNFRILRQTKKNDWSSILNSKPQYL